MAKKKASGSAKSAKTPSVVSEARHYELMLILRPNLRESEVKKKLKELTDMVDHAGGKVLVEDLWGKRELTYRIKGQDEGIYAVYNFEMPSDLVKEFKEHLRIEKEVLRSLFVNVPEGYKYTKYDWEAAKERPVLKREKKTGGSPRQNPVASAPRRKDEVKTEDKKKGQEANEAELDKKLDEIIGGDDLKL
jgi:small subunit ribosomal protein S6